MTSHHHAGGCYCGDLQLSFTTTRAIADLQPRACDCRFCRKHEAAWISDAEGALQLQAREPAQLGRFRQGSEAAEFLLCQRCGVLCAVIYRADGACWAAVNSRAIDSAEPLPAAVTASPQKLGAGEKIERWRRLWIPRVRLPAGL